MNKMTFHFKRGADVVSKPYPEGQSLPSFNGQPHIENARFFFAPPDEIGKVEYAYTDMSAADNLSPVKYKAFKITLGILAGLAVGYAISWLIGLSMLWSAVVTVVSGLLAYSISSKSVEDKSYMCYYLGKKGVAQGELHSKVERSNIKTIVFGEGLVSHYLNERSDLTVSFRWFMFFEKTVQGKYWVRMIISGPESIIQKTQTLWYNFLYNEIIQPTIDEVGFYPFYSGVIFYKDCFTFSHKGEVVRVDNTNLHLLGKGTITERVGGNNVETPFLFLQEEVPEPDRPIVLAPDTTIPLASTHRIGTGALFSSFKDPTPITQLINAHGKYDIFDCGVIFWHIDYLKAYYSLKNDQGTLSGTP